VASSVSGASATTCPCWKFFDGDATPFIAEGLTRDPVTDRVFVAGVAARRIVAIQKGRARDFVRLPDEYSPFAIAISGRMLWVTAAVTYAAVGHSGQSALFAYDLTGKIAGTYPVRDEGRHSLGDLAIAPDGTVYASDAFDGAIYVLRPGAQSLTRLGPRKLFDSPQGMVVSADGKSLLVSDYARGLARLDLASAISTPVEIREGVNVKGIDGLVRLSDGSFLASQNGTKKAHILHLTLSPDWSKLQAVDESASGDWISDPSLLLADDSGAYVVGVSQWKSFDLGQKPAKPLEPWRIVKLDLNRPR
jgi:sugar lactone lactonase YvrE